MNAEEARQMTLNSIRGPLMGHILEHIYTRIQRAAKEGKSQIVNPLQGIRTPISGETKNAVYKRLLEDGYNVKHHVNPDSAGPRSHSYTTVSW